MYGITENYESEYHHRYHFHFFLAAICSLARPWEALLIGALGALLACPGCALLDRLRIDDPVGCVPTHCLAGIWGLLSVALFAEKDILENRFSNEFGIFKGGPWRFLGVQMLVVVSVAAWAGFSTFLELLFVDKLLGLRMSVEDELLGADEVEHGIAKHEMITQDNDIVRENGHEHTKPLELNVGQLKVSEGGNTSQRNENRGNYSWKTVHARRKLLRLKWRKAASLNSAQNDNLTNGTFVMKGFSVYGGVDSDCATEFNNHNTQENVNATQANGNVITMQSRNDFQTS